MPVRRHPAPPGLRLPGVVAKMAAGRGRTGERDEPRMTGYFFYGSLRHRPLLANVLGRDVPSDPVRLHDHRVLSRPGDRWPTIVPAPGETVQGILVHGLSEKEAARLNYYRANVTLTLREVEGPDGLVEALTYLPPLREGAVAWDYDEWARDWGAVLTAAAGDIMAGMGELPAVRDSARMPQILGRAASRLRAGAGGRALRGLPPEGAVTVAARRHPYVNYFAVEEYDLTFRRFDGGTSERVTRAVFVMGDAATVIPYDPRRDRVLLVEQFRAGPYARGDRQPWLLEPIAGRVDMGETPEDAARREAREEAGLELGPLVEVARYYSSPGAVTEYIYAYVALTDLPDGSARISGLSEEAEDIRGHLMSFDALMDLVRSGESGNAPLVCTAWWLAANRDRLRAEAQGGAG